MSCCQWGIGDPATLVSLPTLCRLYWGSATPRAAEEHSPAMPTQHMKSRLHQAVIHRPFLEAPRSLSLCLPRRREGKSPGSRACGHRAESSPEPRARALLIPGNDRALLCTGDSHLCVHRHPESPVVPTGGFLFRLRLHRSRFLVVSSCLAQRSRAEPSCGCWQHHLQRGLLPASFTRCRHLTQSPPHAFPCLAQKLNDFEQVVSTHQGA